MGSKLTKESMASKEPNKEQSNKEPNKEQSNKESNKEQSNKEPKKSTFQRLLARLQMRPNKSDKWSKSSNVVDSKTQSPPPKPPLRNHAERMQSRSVEREGDPKKSEWTEVSLQVAESPPKNTVEQEIKITPVPPPRKHKVKLQEILDSPKRIKELKEKTPSIPVEEPLIVPKKVIEHVCDGTHHHVHNVVNGTVVDQIIHLEHSKEVKPSKSSAKHASTLSLPSYNDLKKKEDKRASSPTKTTKKKSSASSLPTDKKPKTSHSAAEKIESYMIRCKSFGSIIPHAKNEKSKQVEPDSDKESIDSWSGLEDWDLGIIEHEVSTDLPQTPIKTKAKHRGAQTNNNSLQKENTGKINKKLDMAGIDQLLASIDNDTPNKSTSRQITQTEIKKSPHIPDETTSRNHGSYPFKNTSGKSVFENDAFFTTEFIKHESNQFNNFRDSSQIKLAPLAAFDSDKESDKDANINELLNGEHGETLDLNEPITTECEKVEEDRDEKKITVSNTDKSVPHLIPRRKSSSGHSKLLKFIKEPKEGQISENQIKTKAPDSNDEKTKKNDEKDNFEKIEEPKIVPEIKNLDISWHNLIKRNDLNDIPLLEQESSISDLVETSSDDTRSTTIETFHK